MSPLTHRAGPTLGALLFAVLLVAAGFASVRTPVAAQNGTPAASATPGIDASPADGTDPAVAAAAAYLVAQQGPDGGFLGFSGAADAGTTAGAVVALRAAAFAGVDAAAAIDAAAAYLEREGSAYAATGPGQAANLLLAAVAAGRDPAAFGGVDLLAALGGPSSDTGFYGNGVFDHALVLLARAAANAPSSAPDVDALRAAQIADGSWAFSGETTPGAGDTNTTALVVQALVAASNGTDPMVAPALAYLQSAASEAGQYAYQPADPLLPDANSTALVLQAVVAVGQDATAPAWRDVVAGLGAFQNESGALRYQDDDPADNLLATLQGLPALTGLPFPVATACVDAAGAATAEVNEGTPVVALPAPGRGQAPCVELAEAA